MNMRELVKRIANRKSIGRLARAACGVLTRPCLRQRNFQYDEDSFAVMRRCLRIDSNCVDVGSHRGSFLAEIVRLASRGTHLAFEPLPHLYKELVASYGSMPNVRLYELALSDTVGERTFQYVVSNSGYSGFRRRRYDRPSEVIKELEVRSELLDNIVPDNMPIDFIKIDVEGAELEVMRGAVTTIKRSSPTIVFEHGLGAADYYGTSPEAVYDLLGSECGLQIFLMREWLRGAPALTRREFARQFYQKLNFYFMARK